MSRQHTAKRKQPEGSVVVGTAVPLTPRQELERLQRYFEDSPEYPLTAGNMLFLVSALLKLEARITACESTHAKEITR